MGITTISGNVSGVREHADVSGNREQVQTRRSVHFRVGNRPATMKSVPHLVEGDVVTVAGHDKAEFEALALRNESTGVVYQVMNPFLTMAAGVVVILCSIPLAILIFPPLIFIPMGIYIIWKSIQTFQAVKLLESTPTRTTV